METRSRNTALVLISAGLYLLLGNMLGFLIVSALLILLLGIYLLRTGEKEKRGYLLVAIGGFLLLQNMIVILGVVLIFAGYLLLKSKQVPKDKDLFQKFNLVQSIKLGKEQWNLYDLNVYSFIGEVQLDLSLAIIEQRETTLIFQGFIGDIDIIIPEDVGVSITANVSLGQASVAGLTEAGFFNKVVWESLNYDTRPYKVNLIVSYVIGDIKVRML